VHVITEHRPIKPDLIHDRLANRLTMPVPAHGRRDHFWWESELGEVGLSFRCADTAMAPRPTLPDL
jgi:hypothetical protein